VTAVQIDDAVETTARGPRAWKSRAAKPVDVGRVAGAPLVLQTDARGPRRRLQARDCWDSRQFVIAWLCGTCWAACVRVRYAGTRVPVREAPHPDVPGGHARSRRRSDAHINATVWRPE